MSYNLAVLQSQGKFVVTKNGQPVSCNSDGQSKITEFDNRQDAEKYMTILKTLLGRKKNVKN